MINKVYKITNKINNKIYIGLTIQGSRTRYLHHLYEARSGSSFPIHRAIRKYGEDNFEIEVIQVLDSPEELKELEKYYIKEYKTNNRKFGYNMTEGGDGTFGRLYSEETKEKIRQKALGRKMSEGTKERMSLSHSKNKNEEWYKEIKRNAVKQSNLKRSKGVEILDIETQDTKSFISIAEASKELNVDRRNIQSAIRRNNLLLKKYKVQFKNNL